MKTINRSQLIELYKSLKETKPNRPIVIWGLSLTGRFSILEDIYSNRLSSYPDIPFEGNNKALKDGKLVLRKDNPDYFNQFYIPNSFDHTKEYIDVCVWKKGRKGRIDVSNEGIENAYRYFRFLKERVCPYKPLVWIIDSDSNPKLAPDLETYADVYDYQLTCEDWIEYAESINVSPIIINFIQKHKEFINDEYVHYTGEKHKRCIGYVWKRIDRKFKAIIANDDKELYGELIDDLCHKYGDLYIELKAHGTIKENLPLLCLLVLIHLLPFCQVHARNEIIQAFAEMYNLTNYLPKKFKVI